MIKFLHAADLHLDAPFAALSPEQAAARRQEQRELLNELAEAANTHDCDLVLLAGDLFDSAGASDETLLALRRALASIRAPVFISPGNHDCLLPGSAYLTERWPENVHIFKTDAIEAVELPEKQLRVYGAGFTARHERPLLEGFRAKADGWTNLMVLHGDATQAASPYNPITPEQLAASGLAYLALGHIHQASGLLRCGSTYYAWPGCAMGRGFDELGQKGAYLGEVSDSGVRLDLLPLHGRSYEILRVEAGDDALAAVTAALPEDTQNDIYRVILTGERSGSVDTAAINTRVFESESKAKMLAEAKMMSSLEFYAGDRIAVMPVTLAMRAQTGVTGEELEDVAGIPRKIEGVLLGITIKEHEGECHISLRSKEPVNADEIAEIFGGGGHRLAAGITIKGTVEEAARLLVAEAVKHLPKEQA